MKTYLSDNPKTNLHGGMKGLKTRPLGGTVPISGPRSQTVDEGIILVGDAAGFTSPLFEGELLPCIVRKRLCQCLS